MGGCVGGVDEEECGLTGRPRIIDLTMAPTGQAFHARRTLPASQAGEAAISDFGRLVEQRRQRLELDDDTAACLTTVGEAAAEAEAAERRRRPHRQADGVHRRRPAPPPPPQQRASQRLRTPRPPTAAAPPPQPPPRSALEMHRPIQLCSRAGTRQARSLASAQRAREAAARARARTRVSARDSGRTMPAPGMLGLYISLRLGADDSGVLSHAISPRQAILRDLDVNLAKCRPGSYRPFPLAQPQPMQSSAASK
jgi:hypothetical protein